MFGALLIFFQVRVLNLQLQLFVRPQQHSSSMIDDPSLRAGLPKKGGKARDGLLGPASAGKAASWPGNMRGPTRRALWPLFAAKWAPNLAARASYLAHNLECAKLAALSSP